jgi:hypothetical protein
MSRRLVSLAPLLRVDGDDALSSVCALRDCLTFVENGVFDCAETQSALLTDNEVPVAIINAFTFCFSMPLVRGCKFNGFVCLQRRSLMRRASYDVHCRTVRWLR